MLVSEMRGKRRGHGWRFWLVYWSTIPSAIVTVAALERRAFPLLVLAVFAFYGAALWCYREFARHQRASGVGEF
jgi:hypothetical protein